MKLKNVKIGMKVQVKEDADLIDNWYSSSKGRVGEVIRTDTSDNLFTVKCATYQIAQDVVDEVFDKGRYNVSASKL